MNTLSSFGLSALEQTALFSVTAFVITVPIATSCLSRFFPALQELNQDLHTSKARAYFVITSSLFVGLCVLTNAPMVFLGIGIAGLVYQAVYQVFIWKNPPQVVPPGEAPALNIAPNEFNPLAFEFNALFDAALAMAKQDFNSRLQSLSNKGEYGLLQLAIIKIILDLKEENKNQNPNSYRYLHNQERIDFLWEQDEKLKLMDLNDTSQSEFIAAQLHEIKFLLKNESMTLAGLAIKKLQKLLPLPIETEVEPQPAEMD